MVRPAFGGAAEALGAGTAKLSGFGGLPDAGGFGSKTGFGGGGAASGFGTFGGGLSFGSKKDGETKGFVHDGGLATVGDTVVPGSEKPFTGWANTAAQTVFAKVRFSLLSLVCSLMVLWKGGGRQR